MNTERPIEYRCKDSWGIEVVGAEWADAKIAGMAAELAKLKAVNALFRKALRVIEKETRLGGQLTIPEINEIARAALPRAQEA